MASPSETIRFPVTGLSCGACVVHITKAVRRLPGVGSVKVDLRRETVTIRREPGRPTDADLAAAIAEVGYAAITDAIELVPAEDRPTRFARLLGR